MATIERAEKFRLAGLALAGDGVIAHPTEAVWGFACEPMSWPAVQKLLRLKGRSVTKGLILVAADIEQFSPYLEGLGSAHLEQLRASWPAPLTWLVPDNGFAPPWIRGHFSSVALRVSDHPVVASLCRSYGGPIVSSSANTAGAQAAIYGWQVRRQFAAVVDYYLAGPQGKRSKPSEIRDLLTGQVLRSGGV